MRQFLPVPKINRIAEFDDAVLEREFFSQHLDGARHNYPLAALMSGLVLLVLLVFGRAEASFAEQAAVMLLVLFASFLVRARWIHNVLFSVAALAAFLLFSAWRFGVRLLLDHLHVAVYVALGIAIAAINSYSLHVNRRKQYFRERQLEILSITDRLTGIYNRQKIDDVFAEWTETPGQSRFSVIMFDLDDFKSLNDRHGHLVGDRVLTECARSVRAAIRDQDILARWGGEEFMILLPETGIADAVEVAERLKKEIETLSFEQGLRITASFGVTRFVADDTIDTLTVRVDRLLYQAKAQGKNRICSDRTPARGSGNGFITMLFG